jgi:phosphatidylserine/phosphatidylglycerophosphate/cardiolipin synthase-like enzyme
MDSKKLFIGSAPNENTTRLDIGLVSNNPNYIRIFKNLFYTDLNHQEFKYEIIKDIGIAPYNLRLLVERLLLQAKKSIYLMFPVITDDSIILQILQNQMAKKVKVFVLCSPNIFNTDENESIDKKFNDQLVSFGATLKESYEPIIHNRCILIDPDVEHNQGSIAYIGSGNLKTSSLDKSREAALTTKDKKVINSLFSIFKELWVK